MKIMKKKAGIGNGGQSMVEYVVILIIVLGAFIGIQNYVKRGIQGRWREAVDTLGDQYDPLTAETDMTHSISSETTTEIMVVNDGDGFWTRRQDESTSTETKSGTSSVGAYAQ